MSEAVAGDRVSHAAMRNMMVLCLNFILAVMNFG